VGGKIAGGGQEVKRMLTQASKKKKQISGSDSQTCVHVIQSKQNVRNAKHVDHFPHHRIAGARAAGSANYCGAVSARLLALSGHSTRETQKAMAYH